MALISVIIPCYNARLWIQDALNSVQEQALDGLEVIVVDDGSTDGSADLVEAACPSARVIRIENAGPSRARNVGTQAATGSFFQYLDADDVLAPGKIRQQWAVLEETGADVAYGAWQRLTETSARTFVTAEKVQPQLGDDPEATLLTAAFWCPPAAYLFRRSLVERIGGWNETLPIIQDARFVLDCALYGGRFVFCTGLMAYYRIHSGPSVSRRDPAAFLQDCLRNAEQLEAFWQAGDGLNDRRTAGLVEIYEQVARGSYRNDAAAFERAYNALNRLRPNYTPQSPRHLAWTARLFGYRNAEEIAYHYRRIKQRFSRITPT